MRTNQDLEAASAVLIARQGLRNRAVPSGGSVASGNSVMSTGTIPGTSVVTTNSNPVAVRGVVPRRDIVVVERNGDVIGRLDAAVMALSGVDLSELSDTAIEQSLDRLSTALCQVDVLLSRLAEETRLRGFTIVEA